MNIQFLGAARTVTGSAYYLESPLLKLFVDCGMFQGSKKLQGRNTLTHFPPVKDIPYLLLTHAHIDHCGLIPLMVRRGFRGKILATEGTCDLCEIMLRDSAHVQQMDADWQNRKNQRSGKGHIEPLYTLKDVDYALKLFSPVSYDQMINLTPEARVRFRDAGHILGSAMIEFWWSEKDNKFKLVFSGDIGNWKQPIIKDPSSVEEADFLLIESTYGNRLHKSMEDTEKELEAIVNRAIQDQEKVIIPAFAVERTQDLIYILSNFARRGQLASIPVYIDSPLATAATEIFRRYPGYFDNETRTIMEAGENPLDLPGLIFTRTSEESKKINEKKEAAIVIAASGMCDAGRIKHHLKHNLWRPGAHIVFTGYQAAGTLGREIIEGKKQVRVLGEEVQVKANIHTLGGFSAHADQVGLLNWLGNFKNQEMKVFVVHGEEQIAINFAEVIKERFTFSIVIPRWKEVFEIKKWGVVFQPEEKEDMAEILNLLEKNIQDLKKDAGEKKLDKEGERERILQKIRELNSDLEQMLRSS
jgi:metallo-beta-lactamase family protein